MKVAHSWLKDFVGDSIPSPEEIEKLLTFHAFEIEGREKVGEEVVIDVDVLPNRSSDCLCHRGIAREVATLIEKEPAKDPFRDPIELQPITPKISVVIEDEAACRRFGAALLSGVSVKDSPDWLKNRLEAIGQRPINNVVDATNYIMFSLGQPLHAYDGDLFPNDGGVWKFGVRMARDGEKVTTLSNEVCDLDESVQLIVEGMNDTPVGIAGVKGGKSAEINQETKTVILEAANFDPTITRKAAQKLKLPTDASRRFENEVSREVIPYALQACAELLVEIGGGVIEGYHDTYPTPYENPFVSVTLAHINERLGLELQEKDVEDIFSRLGFEHEGRGGMWKVRAPFERTDINIAEDVIEEVGRVYGYEHVESVVPGTVPLSGLNTRHYYSEVIREVLISLGFSEVITSSFRKKDEISLQNALASDKGCLRSSLEKNIEEVLEKNIGNIDLLGIADVRVFEIGTVFYKGEGGVEEHVSVALGVRKKATGPTPKDNGALEEAKRALEERLEVTIEESIESGTLEFNFTKLLNDLPKPKGYETRAVGEEKQYRPFSQYPHVSRDIALWVPESVKADEVEGVLNEHAGELRVRTDLFDEFKKDGRVSYAFRIVFQSNEKTLTDDEVNEHMARITSAAAALSWEVR